MHDNWEKFRAALCISGGNRRTPPTLSPLDHAAAGDEGGSGEGLSPPDLSPAGDEGGGGGGGEGEKEDLLSALPDDILLLVLLHLPSAAAAAWTCVLSCRWSRLWAQLPELRFPLPAEPAVARRSPAMGRLSVVANDADPRDAAAVLRLAAPRLTNELLFHNVLTKVREAGARAAVENLRCPASTGPNGLSSRQPVVDIVAPVMKMIKWIDRYDPISVQLGQMAHLQRLATLCFELPDHQYNWGSLMLLQCFQKIPDLYISICDPHLFLSMHWYKSEVREALKMMKGGKAMGPDGIPIEVWRCLGDIAIVWLTKLFNHIFRSNKMPDKWRRSILVSIYKNKGDIQSCTNYRGIKLMSHTMKLWERVIEHRLRAITRFSMNQFGFMPGRSTMEAIFLIRQVMERYMEKKKNLHGFY
ncbi:uncharacterized protein [Miscanthus floridulus]|uniref:uncharacterized protein n=1 Tax=Miscanthus floridulus TaxID=154761 RepID=UPI003458C0E5